MRASLLFLRFLSTLSLLSLFPRSAHANVEKTIFLGPETINIPHQHPTLEDLNLEVLDPHEKCSIRTYLAAEFPSAAGSRHGKATWLLLDNLTPGQRYEVRICWAATQPTAFTLRVHQVPAVWDTPDLISSLAAYSASRTEESAATITSSPAGSCLRRRRQAQVVPPEGQAQGEHQASVLFLEILAAADYVSANETLMKSVPPVHVDIILDPFILNLLPRSLAPTVGYILVVALVSWLVAHRVARWLAALASSVAAGPSEDKKTQ